MNTSRSQSTVLLVLLVLTWANPAGAYIDGGSGSLLLQAAISGVLGGLFVIRSFWANLVARRHRVVSEPAASKNEPRA